MSEHLSVEDYLEITRKNSPVICRIIGEYGNLSLREFLKELTPNARPSFQPLNDLVEIVYRYAEPLLGKSTAKAAAEAIAAAPVVLTANHHGVDFFAQSVQGSLLFYLSQKLENRSGAAVPIFACGSVPLDNLTYPLGLLLYNVDWNKLEDMPRKLPIFSNSLRRAMVSVASPLNGAMVQRAETRFDRMVQEKDISPGLASRVRDILREDYCSQTVMALSNYSQQSVVLNHRIWKRLFSNPDNAPAMVYLELERLVSTLLQRDLKNPNSLAFCVMFDSVLREAVSKELNGARACWNLEMLEQRLGSHRMGASQGESLRSCGTFLFWGINAKGRRVPLCFENSGQGNPMLRGIDDRGNLWEAVYTPQSILDALREGRLLPSLFTCFLVLSFARGVTCAGGYFQGEYLPSMQSGLVKALRTIAGYREMADIVKGVTAYTYLSGMQAVMVRIGNGALIPAGPIEILAGGGLANNDIEKILSLSVRDAHVASLFETVPDVAPWVTKTADWKKQLAVDCYPLLEDKVVIK